MTSVIASFRDLATSVFEVIFSLFKTAFDSVYKLLLNFMSFFVDIFKTAFHTLKSIFDAAGGLVGFLASNIIVIALIAASGYGYVKYQRSQGRTVQVGDKRL
ncbi:hypothetical protein BDV29DRAFT_172446, partial [Aspergillus leporis]